MKRILLPLLFVLLCGRAAAQGPTITVTNDTGYTIMALYISDNNSDDWEDDVLGRKTLSDGDSFTVTLPENGTYDFKAVDEDEDDYIKWNVMVRGNTTITFTMDDFNEATELEDATDKVKTEEGKPEPDGSTWVIVSNETDYDIYYLYISRGDADSWEDDILGTSQILRAGKEVRVTLPGPGVWDFMGEDTDDDQYSKTDITITRGANRVVFKNSDLD